MLPGRTSQAAVAKLIEVDSDFDLDQFIDTANELVTELCAPYGYTSYRLELIERWLAAHFYAVEDPRSSAEKVSSLSQRLQGKIDLGFDSSVYGQQAMRLDTKGHLSALNNYAKNSDALARPQITGGVSWLGTRFRQGPCFPTLPGITEEGDICDV